MKYYPMYCRLLFVLVVVALGQNAGASNRQELPGIVLEGNNSLTIQGKTIVLKGNIQVKGNAKLTFRDSTLTVEQDYPQQYNLELHDNAIFEIDRVSVPTSLKTWMNWEYYDSSKVLQTDFHHSASIWQVVHGSSDLFLTNSSLTVTFLDYSKANLLASNPDFVWIELGLPAGMNYDLTLPNGQKNIYWNSPVSLPYRIKLLKANIHKIDFDISDNVHVVVRNSSQVGFGWLFGLGDSDAANSTLTVNGFAGGSEIGFSEGISPTDTISGLKKQYYIDSTFSAGSNSQSSSVRLINSSLENWWPTVWKNHTLNLNDCSLADPRAYDNSSVNITNSTMTMFGSYQNSKVKISKSSIDSFIEVMDYSVMDLENVIFSGQVTKDPNAVLRRVKTTPISPNIGAFVILSKVFGSESFYLTAPTSPSSGAWSYTSSKPSVATVSGSMITVKGVGTTKITATQATSGNYTSGTKTATFMVTKAAPTFGGFSIPTKVYGSAAFTLTAPTSTSSGAWSYSSSRANVATVSGNKVAIKGVGITMITAVQAASGNYTSGSTTAILTVTAK
jgi:hypothetical protein